jgi:glycosyltransferase involved in cell wall biosynthesis
MSGERTTGGRHVWIVNHYAVGPDMPSGTRHYSLARQLVARGHRVTIFAASFDHASGRERFRWGRALARRQNVDGVQFVWLRTIPYQGNTIRRQFNMLSFLLMFLLAQVGEARPDVVIGSTVHPFAAFGGWLVARVRGVPFVFEIRDLWPQTLVDLGALRVGSPFERGLRLLEAFLVRRATAVITLLPGIRDYLQAQGLPDAHVVYLPNGADLGTFAPGAVLPDPAPAAADVLTTIDRLRGEGRFVLGYVGALGRVNRADLLVEAAAIAEEQAPGRIGMLVVGDGPERASVAAGAEGRAGVAVMAPIGKTQVPRVLRALDATVVHTTWTPVYRYGVSFNKLYEYMAAERPVVFACETAYDPVEASGAGVTIRPDDAAALAAAFLRLADLPSGTREAMGAAGRAYVAREHDYDRLGETLAAVVEGRLPAP